MTRKLAVAMGFLLAASCAQIPFVGDDILSLKLDAVAGNPVDLAALEDNTASVFVFLAPDCPLSQNYTLTLNELTDQFADDSVGFYGVIAGGWFSREENEEFAGTYQTRFPVLLDPDFVLAGHFDAMVTPEAFVVDDAGRLLYHGAIDNWAGELGQHRTVVTAHYLRDALARIVLGRAPEITATQAVGCYIERLG